MPKPKLFYLLAGISLFLLVTGVAYWIFSYTNPAGSNSLAPTTSPSPSKKSKLDPSLPRTEACPLNGKLFTVQERDAWQTRRPLGVMVENSQDSRPQSGLSTADIVYEAVAEGGITRLMALFYCEAALTGNIMIAPVRSARIHFVNLITEYDGLYNHVGGAGHCTDPNVDPRAKALCAIGRYKVKDLDQFNERGAGAFKVCHRVTNRLEKEVAWEHTMACFLDELYVAAGRLKWTNVDEKGVSWDKNFTAWKFKAPSGKSLGNPAARITYFFWGENRGVGDDFNKDFDVSWTYDSATNSYTRSNGGQISIDLNTNEPLSFSNIVVQFAREIATHDVEKHIVYELVGSGKAIVFLDGVAIDAVWTKTSPTSRTLYRDPKGAPIQFNPGPIWISILPIGNPVTFN